MKMEVKVFAAAALTALFCQAAMAYDINPGRFGASFTANEVYPLGDQAKAVSGNATGGSAGAMLHYAFSPNFSLGISYENISLKNGLRYEPFILQAIVYPYGSAGSVRPSVRLGHGIAPQSLRAGLGLEWLLSRSVGLGFTADYSIIGESGNRPDLAHLMQTGLAVSFYWGKAREKAAEMRGTMQSLPVKTTTQKPLAAPAARLTAETPAAAPAEEKKVQPLPAQTPLQIIAIEPSMNVEEVRAAAEALQRGTRVMFSVNRASMDTMFSSKIKSISDFLKTFPGCTAVLEGHTDNTGSEQLNLKLSLQRAETVRNELINTGIPASRLGTRGYGMSKPAVPNDTEQGRALNRRVEVVITIN